MSQGQEVSGQAGVRANRSKMSALLMPHGSGTHYLFWVRQPENIPLVQTGDPKPGNSASPMPYVYVSVNVLQHKAGPTHVANSKRRHRYTACDIQS